MASGPRRDRHGPVDDHGSPTRSGVPGTVPRRTTAALASGLAAILLAGCGGTTAGDAAPAPVPHAVTPSATSAPLLTSVPDASSERGEVVEDFPTDLLPVPPDAVLLVSSAVPLGGDVREVSVNLSTEASVEEVFALYRDALVAAGFTEVPAPTGALDVEATFTRSGGDELVLVGVLDADGRRTVTVGGRIRSDG